MSATYTLERDLMPIMKGKVPLPNARPIEGDVGATILHYSQMSCDHALDALADMKRMAELERGIAS